MPLQFNKAKFSKSYSETAQIEKKAIPEFAFIGRSNVGKSSLINALCEKKDLAKTSSVPGKTQPRTSRQVAVPCRIQDTRV
jgi:GTP-binding protein